MNFRQEVTLSSVALYPLSAGGGVSPDMALGAMPVRPALLVQLVDRDGCSGWGEIWANFPPRANLHKAHLVEDVIAGHLPGLRFTVPEELTAFLRARLSVYFLHVGQPQVFEHVLAGLDTAAWDLCLRKAGESFAAFLGVESEARCYASSINPGDLEKRLADHAALGQSEFKLKIGLDDGSDAAFVAKAAAQLPEGARLMVDSNQVWDLGRAKDMLRRLETFDLLFAEEPIAADRPTAQWEELANSTGIALAAGENVYGVDRFIELANAGVKFLQPDVSKWGGVTGALQLAEKLPAGCRLWPHFMGSAVGQQAGLAISAALGPESKCEMDVNENRLRTDLCPSDARVAGGRVALSREPGLLAPPTEDAVRSFVLDAFVDPDPARGQVT